MSRLAINWLFGLIVVIPLLFLAYFAFHSTGSTNRGFGTASVTPAPPPRINYNTRRICDDAFEKTYDHQKDSIDRISLTLRENCFGPLIRIPSTWHEFFFQPEGNADGWWLSFWVTGSQPRGPFGPNDNPNFDILGNFFRLEGHGRVLLYANVVTRKTERGETSNNMPDEHGIYKPGGDVTPPAVISKVEPQYSDEARHAHWSGTILAIVVVDENGDIHDISIPNSPGMGLDEKVIEALHKWKLKPAELDGKPVPTRTKVEVTFKSL